MRASHRADIAVIGGTGLEALLKNTTQAQVGTPYGFPPSISLGEVNGKMVAFLPRHGVHHSVPPHKVNYRANIYALHQLGVKRIIATNAVGAINLNFKPGDVVIPHDLIDFTKLRPTTFYDEAPVTHVDATQLYCPETRRFLVEASKKHEPRTWSDGILVCTEGPRYETPAEIRMFRQLGCDVVGMTSVPEAVLSMELEMCYAGICFVSNMAAGIKERLTTREVSEVAKEKMLVLQKILKETIGNLPLDRSCPCAHALRDARFQG